MTSQQQTLDQKRARQAWENVKAVKKQPFEGDYGSLARRIPALVQTNGLGQTLAFLKAKGNDNKAHQVLYDHLSDWVVGQMGWRRELLVEVVERDTAGYRRATAEAMAFLNWLKRFAEAELEAEEAQR
jgi:CRISPR-associated protein Cmr5